MYYSIIKMYFDLYLIFIFTEFDYDIKWQKYTDILIMSLRYKYTRWSPFIFNSYLLIIVSIIDCYNIYYNIVVSLI